MDPRRTAALLALVLAVPPALAQSPTWTRQVGSVKDDYARASAPDGTGGLFVAGDTLGQLGAVKLGGSDAWLARYDGAGNRLWLEQFGSHGVNDTCHAAAPDGEGGVFLAGDTVGALGGPHLGGLDAWLVHYDRSGSCLWARQFGTNGADRVRGLAEDGSGGVFVGGYGEEVAGPGSGPGTAWIARYDADGARLWIRQLGTVRGEEAYCLAPDGRGGCLVGGGTHGNLAGPNAGKWDAWLARLDAGGALTWARQLGTGEDDVVKAACADALGNLFVCGWTLGDLAAPNSGLVDVWVARLGPTGSTLWIQQLGTGLYDTAWSVEPDGSGGVYVGGEAPGSLVASGLGGTDAWLAHYDASGGVVGAWQLGTGETELLRSIRPDGAGGLFVSGWTKGDLGGPNAGLRDAFVARLAGPCGGSSTYCVASATSIPGCQAAIGVAGWPTLSDPLGFEITSGNVPGGSLGLCLFSDRGPASTPIGTLGGLICVQVPRHPTRPRAGGGSPGLCDGELAFTLQDLVDAAPIVVPGAVLHAQVWARDRASPDGFLLSNGLELTVCP